MEGMKMDAISERQLHFLTVTRKMAFFFIAAFSLAAAWWMITAGEGEIEVALKDKIQWILCAYMVVIVFMMGVQQMEIHVAGRRRRAIRKEYLRCRAEGRTWAPFG